MVSKCRCSHQVYCVVWHSHQWFQNIKFHLFKQGRSKLPCRIGNAIDGAISVDCGLLGCNAKQCEVRSEDGCDNIRRNDGKNLNDHRHHTPQDYNPQLHCRQNVKPQKAHNIHCYLTFLLLWARETFHNAAYRYVCRVLVSFWAKVILWFFRLRHVNITTLHSHTRPFLSLVDPIQ
jgi:hypothetical protein